MRITDEGVIGNSFMNFTIPSDFARRALYCCPQFGHFYCNSMYNVERDYLDMFLLIYIREGSLTLETRDRSFIAQKGDVALLDCHYPHRYYCEDTSEILWLHYFGSSSKDYADYLYDQHGIIFSGESVSDLFSPFMSVIHGADTAVVNEHAISTSIHQILARLADAKQRTGNTYSLLQPAISYIRENYSEEIDLDMLSELCAISKPHLIRCFKKYMNSTPHEYILATRLRNAKRELISTSNSIEEIAANCGFNSASHFTRAFKLYNGTTPTEFRRIQF